LIDLYVDDVRKCPDGWIVARTIEAAKEALTLGHVRRLSLDHDMGACDNCIAKGEHIGDMATPETTFLNWCKHVEDGTKLVYWMIETNTWPQEMPTVHSMNPCGRERMVAMIQRYWPERHQFA